MNFQESLKIYLTEDEINDLLTSLSKKRSYCLLINTNKITFEDLKKYFKTLRPHPFIQNAYYYDGSKWVGINCEDYREPESGGTGGGISGGGDVTTDPEIPVDKPVEI